MVFYTKKADLPSELIKKKQERNEKRNVIVTEEENIKILSYILLEVPSGNKIRNTTCNCTEKCIATKNS